MRRSSRRRVIPRLSSSASRGTACLRVIPAASRNSPTVNPAGRLASRAAAGGGGADGVGVEPQAVPLDQDAAPDQLAQLGPLDARRRLGCQAAGGQAATAG